MYQLSRSAYPRAAQLESSSVRCGPSSPRLTLAVTLALLVSTGSAPSLAGAAGSDEGRPSNPVAGSGQTHIDRPLTADRPGEYPLGRGTVESGADFGSPTAGSGDPDRLGAKGSPYRSRSSGRPRGPRLEGPSITGGSITRDGASGLPE